MSMFYEYEIRLNGLDVDGRNQCKASALLNHLQNAATLAAEDGGFSRETLVERYGVFWMLARLFDNLINNAIKYGADGKRIMVKLHADDEIVTVSVINYGYVIPADELPLIFNKFYRVEQSRSTNTGGTGLGLAISKNIVDMHGGTITVTSDLSGTVFTVKLKVNFDVNKENFGKIG